jgi:type I restriction enzyme, S subunit
MSGTKFLRTLLNDVAVEWTSLGDERFVEVANAARKPVKASLRISGKTPYYGANNIQDYVDGYTHDGEYVLIAEDGSASIENYSVQYATGKFWANNHVHVVRGKQRLNSRFLYHYLRFVDFTPYLPNKDRSKLTKGEMIKIPLAIPCPDDPQKSLEIQAEIVRVLDAFTEFTAELTTELTAELTARKKQYNYYRDQLLSFVEGKVEWKRLGDIVRIKNGKDHKSLSDGNFPVYGSGGVMRYADKYAYDKPSVLIPRKGSLGNLFFVDVPFWNVDTIFYTEINDALVRPKFLYYFLTTVGLGEMNKSGGVPSQTQSVLSELKIPVPSLQEQTRIVSVLEKFEALTTSLAESLPCEIKLRQKQYEYYRDLLLSFPNLEVPEA